MERYKQHKSTLIVAAIVIFLCLLSITGATFALFTDRTEDGKIGINATSGNIEVDIVDSSSNPSSIVGNVLSFVTASGKEEVLFEPGALYHTEGFRVTNDGSVPISFIIYISEDKDITEGFYDAFEVWLTKDPTTKGDMEKMQEFRGRLEADQKSDIYYLVFRMKETAGNEFQGRPFSGVGITVCAVQGNGYTD